MISRPVGTPSIAISEAISIVNIDAQVRPLHRTNSFSLLKIFILFMRYMIEYEYIGDLKILSYVSISYAILLQNIIYLKNYVHTYLSICLKQTAF